MKIDVDYQDDDSLPFEDILALLRKGKLGESVQVKFFFHWGEDNKPALSYTLEADVPRAVSLKAIVNLLKDTGEGK